MKICIFSDIHGNGPAFKAAYQMIVSEKADLNIFLGDICGYYYDQIEIFSILQTIPNLIAIKGNHDIMFLNITKGNKDLRREYLKKYGLSMENLLSENSQELLQWLSTLNDTFSFPEMKMACFHGSPWNPAEGYVYPDTPVEDIYNYDYRIFLLGHTHYPMVRHLREVLIVNPGSLGQPRNGGLSTYAILEISSKKTVIKEVPYDKTELLKHIDAHVDKNPYLKKVPKK